MPVKGQKPSIRLGEGDQDSDEDMGEGGEEEGGEGTDEEEVGGDDEYKDEGMEEEGSEYKGEGEAEEGDDDGWVRTFEPSHVNIGLCS